MPLHAQLPMRDDAARGEKKQGAAPGRAQCRCTKNQHQRGAAAAPEGRGWPPTAPALGCPRGLSVLLHAPLLVPSGASVRGTKPKELL